MSSEEVESKTLKPHLILAAIFFVIIAAVLLWPSSDEQPPEPVAIEPVAQEVVTPEPEEPVVEEPVVETFSGPPEIQEVVIDPVDTPEPQAPVEVEPEIVFDTSDAAITSALLEIANTPVVGRLLVDDNLLQRFVVTVTNLADEDVAPNHQLLTPPEQNFRVYQQAGREWIDAASYKRYTPYVDALETMSNDQLVELYNNYLPDISEVYAEISGPSDDFTDTLVEALNVLLDTPEIPTPVEVYSDSVMYKYKDERIEALSLPQKQLLRMGPDNMRRVKAKLRELKEQLENGS